MGDSGANTERHNMRMWATRGFTLVELLVIIAVIAILAGIGFPAVLDARVAALERNAQTYSAAVSKALTAVLASDSQLQPLDVVGGTYNCGAGAVSTNEVTVDGTAYDYGWSAAPSSVTGCAVAVNPVTSGLDVTITTASGTYVSGSVQ